MIDRDPLEALAEDYFRRRKAGEHPTTEEYAQANPTLADRIRTLFPTLEFLEDSTEWDGEDPRLSAGQTLGPYRIIDELGRGGMGIVLRAEDTRLGRRVALKVLPQGQREDVGSRQRFEHEARLLASLTHPNIVVIHSLEEIDEVRVLTMELVPGLPLSRRIATGALPVDETLAVTRQIALALEAAHERGVIHRDLKPGNVQLAPSGAVKVLDFGLATLVGPSNIDSETSSSASGTAGYISPEQFAGRPVDHRADIWSFGCLLYECLVGSSAFPGRSRTERVQATLDHEPDWSAIPETLPDSVRELMEHSLAKAPEDRLDEIRVFRQAIEQVITGNRHAAVTTTDDPASGRRHNLPGEMNRLLGRDQETSLLKSRLRESRLVTITGPGGGGKTRLALRIARDATERFEHGAWLVELASVSDPDNVANAVASALGVTPGRSDNVLAAIGAFLEHRELLLVLDNCEHVLESVAEVARVLVAKTKNLTVLATSRAPLVVDGESRFELDPLEVPSAEKTRARDIEDNDAVRLFAERGRSIQPRFTLDDETAPFVNAICRELDGLPLALELAASRLAVLSPRQISAGLKNRFELLTKRGPSLLPQHRTLLALFDWSHDQLSDEERTLFRMLSVFRGSFTLASAEAIATQKDGVDAPSLPPWRTMDLLSQLVDRSLIAHDGSSSPTEPRFRMLETLRDYASVKLVDSGSVEAVRSRHLDHFETIAAQLHDQLTAARGWRETLAWADRSQGDFRAAMSYALQPGANLRQGALIAARLKEFWISRGLLSEGARWCDRFAKRKELEGSTFVRTRLLSAMGTISGHRGEFDRSDRELEEVLSIAEENDRLIRLTVFLELGNFTLRRGDYPSASSWHGKALELARDPEPLQRQVCAALLGLGVSAHCVGNGEEAEKLLQESLALARELGEERNISSALSGLGIVALGRGDHRRGLERFNEAILIFRKTGDRLALAGALNNKGIAAKDLGRLEEARSLIDESLTIEREAGGRNAAAHNNLAMVLTLLGDLDEADRLSNESLVRGEELKNPLTVANALQQLSRTAAARGDLKRALELTERELELQLAMSPVAAAKSQSLLATYHALLGNRVQAKELLDSSREVHLQAGGGLLAEFQREVGLWHWLEGDEEQSASALLDSYESLRHLEASHILPDTLELLAAASPAERGVVLRGVADTLREIWRVAANSPAKDKLERHWRRIRAELGELRFDALLAEGHELGKQDLAALDDYLGFRRPAEANP